MTTQNTITEYRNVTPQWKGEKGGNLGEHKVKCMVFDKDRVVELAGKYGDAMAEVLNAQCSIKFLGPEFAFQVGAGFDRIDGEKSEAFQERVRKDAIEYAKEIAKREFDFPALFTRWASKERTTKDKRIPLDGFDALMANITEKWADAPDDKRAGIVAKFKLEVNADDSTADVIAAIRAQYKPVVTVTSGDML